MPKVLFKLDYKKDAENYWGTVNSKNHGVNWVDSVSFALRKQIKGKSWKKSKNIIYKYLEEFYKKNGKKLKFVLNQFSEIWKLFEKEYFKRLERITKRKIYAKEFTAYLTTVNRCPYDQDKGWFMVSLSSSGLSACKIIGHELMHFQLHHYFEKGIVKKIGTEKFWDLKEALTVLLNEEFKDLWIMEDMGYTEHEELREFISKQWRKEKDFDKLIEKCVEFLAK